MGNGTKEEEKDAGVFVNWMNEVGVDVEGADVVEGRDTGGAGAGSDEAWEF